MEFGHRAGEASARVEVVRPADIVFRGGVVRTQCAERPEVQAVAVRDGLIAGLGSDEETGAFIGPRTRVVELAGRALLPGFADAHAHVQQAVSFVHAINLYECHSVAGYLEAVAMAAAAHPGRPVVLGNGWSEVLLPGAGPSKTDLDDIEAGRPVALWSDGHHSLWVNSEALRVIGLDGNSPDPRTGVIERVPDTVGRPGCLYGEPSGTLRESAAETAMTRLPDFSVEEYCDGIRYFQDTIARPRGITLAHDPVCLPGSNAVAAYAKLAATGELTMRVRGSVQVFPEAPLGPQIEAAVAEKARHVGELFQITAVKIFTDGTIEGHTGYLNADYADRPGFRGRPIWDSDALAEACRAADLAGLQIHVHAIGDAALGQALDGLESMVTANGARARRSMITHWQVVDPRDVIRAARLDVVSLVQPYWFVRDIYYDRGGLPCLGAARAEREFPMRSLFAAGMRPASSSDFPVTPSPDPLVGMQGGVMRWLPESVFGGAVEPPGDVWSEEAVTVEQMIETFTINGAQANYLESTTGSLEVGKSADVIVLARDPLRCAHAEIARGNKVLLTMLQGREVYRAPGF